MKRATIYDVAARAGVSHQTVTRYLRGYEGMRETTREKVRLALHELDYQPNAAARQLRLRTSNRVAILADRLGQGGPALIVLGATRHLRERGFVSDILPIEATDPSSVDHAIDVVIGNRVAGILATAQTDIVLERLQYRSLNVPLVVSGPLVSAPDSRRGRAAARMVAQHLVDLGHRRVGYVGGPDGWFASRDRRDGFVSVLRERGVTVAWTRTGDWSGHSGHAAWRSLSAEELDVTAIAAANDSTALGVMAAATDAGLRIPSDLSVVGIDDADESKFVRPALTTVRLNFEGEGALLAERLLGQVLHQGSSPESSTAVTAPLNGLDPLLVVRDSAAAPPPDR